MGTSPTSDGFWTNTEVSRWLIEHGWGSIVHSFRDNDINGQQFLDLTMTKLSDFLPKSELGYGEKRRLIHSVQALRSSQPSHNHDLPSRPNSIPPMHMPSTRPVQQPSTLDSEYARIRPYIPERKSSNTEQLSEIMKTLSIPQQMGSIAAVARGRHLHMTPSRDLFVDRKQGPASPRFHGPSSPETTWKISGRRPAYHQPPFNLHAQRIQVTIDSDVYFSLTVTDLHDAELKRSILSKVGVNTDMNEWLFYHENMLSETPLSDAELIHICRTSDISQTHRILVKHVYNDYGNEMPFHHNDHLPSRPATTSPCLHQPARHVPPYVGNRLSEHYETDTIDSRIYHVASASSHTDHQCPSSRNGGHFLHENASARESPVDADIPSGKHEMTSPSTSKEINTLEQTQNGLPGKQSSAKIHKPTGAADSSIPSEKTAAPISLWAVQPRSLASSAEPQGPAPQGPAPQPRSVTATPALWAVPPRPASTPAPSVPGVSLWNTESQLQSVPITPEKNSLVDAESDTKQLSTSPKPNTTRRLQIQIPESGPRLTPSRQTSPHTPMEPLTPVTGASASPSPPTSACQDPDPEYENWVERPSIERLYKHIDEYLPDHDLDKEIVMEQQQPPSAAPPAPRRLQGHKKSIRIMANEAHRNWRHATNMVRINNIFRRRSTKMWGRKVQQVKPGMEIDPVVASKLTTPSVSAGHKPAPTKLQWIRGQLIGKGSFGRVYHALNVEAGEWIAVKQVDIPTTRSDMQNDKLCESEDALYREISLLGELDHENIVAYLGYDLDKDEGHINIFLEYVPGGSIATCLSNHGKFEGVLVQFFARQILLGLEYLHSRNILHRDIKAGNILLDQNGVCKITDFGLSKLSQPDMAYDAHSSNSLMRGTVYWMAPEVVKGTNYSAKVDIWSLGCTVIEMMTGRNPWIDLNMLAALYNLGKYQPPPIPNDISAEATDFLNQCFIINPEDRPTAADLLVHPFVRQDPSFKFREHMKTMGLERKQSITLA